MNQWQQTRRHFLITKKNAGQATPDQLKELEQLQEIARAWADRVAPMDITKTDKISEIVAELS